MSTRRAVFAAVAALAMTVPAVHSVGAGAVAHPLDPLVPTGSTTSSTTTTTRPATTTTTAPRQTSSSTSGSTAPAPASDTTPANPNANAAARSVLRYLVTEVGAATGRRVSGQHIGNASNFSFSALQKIRDRTGEWLGLVGADIGAGGDPTNLVAALTSYWERGGLVAMSLHPKNPQTGGAYNDMSIDIGTLLKPGTNVYVQWRRQLDSYATALRKLESNGVAVILRPLHEMNCASFWWTYRNTTMTPDRFKALWRQTFEYLTYTKGIDNLIWTFSPHLDNMDQRPASTWYPGDGYVDVLGMDVYKGVYYDAHRTKMLNLRNVAPGKPFVLGEAGPDRSVDPPWDLTTLRNGLRDRFPFVSYFMSWSGKWHGMENHDNLGVLINDPRTVNRGSIDLRRQRRLLESARAVPLDRA